MALSIIIYFLITLGLGSITNLFGWPDEDLFEKIIISSGIGLMLIPVLGVIFAVTGIPIDYRSFLVAAAFTVSVNLIISLKHKRSIPAFTAGLKTFLYPTHLALLAIFGVTLAMYLKGSFSYPWFEDSDPWRYAAAIKYIALKKTYITPFHFIEVAQPYPQGYQILMALMTQINHSLNWSAKFFNSLIISLSLLYFFCLARKFFAQRQTALFAAACLASMPAWLSHFIFAINFSCVILPVFFYALIKMEKNKKWAVLVSLSLASIWLIHFSSAFVITLLFIIFYITKVFCENKLNPLLAMAGFCGFAMSLLFWVPSLQTSNIDSPPGGVYLFMPFINAILRQPFYMLLSASLLILVITLYVTENRWLARLKTLPLPKYIKPIIVLIVLTAIMSFLLYPRKIMPLLGSGSMPYNFNDFFLFKPQPSLIQNPFGIGPLAMAFGIFAFIYCTLLFGRLFTQPNFRLALLWATCVFTFLGVNSARFSVNLMPFRMWAFFAFSAALFNGLFFHRFIFSVIHSRLLRAACVTLFLICLVPTWHVHKYKHNTSIWRENYLGIHQSQKLYGWIKDNLPKDSKIYAMGVSQAIPMVFDMVSFIWDRDVEQYNNKDLQDSWEKNYQFLKSKGYEYLILDEASIIYNKLNRTKYLYAPDQQRQIVFIQYMLILAAKQRQFNRETSHFELIKKMEGSGLLYKIK